MKWSALTVSIVCWSGRVLALGLFLFWGASFVEHLQQGFLHSVKGLTPVWVWLGYLAHLTFLVGLVALWRWPVTGSILTILGSLSYFGGLAISEATKGKQYLSCLEFLVVRHGSLAIYCGFGYPAISPRRWPWLVPSRSPSG
jgi:hypothetical protein